MFFNPTRTARRRQCLGRVNRFRNSSGYGGVGFLVCSVEWGREIAACASPYLALSGLGAEILGDNLNPGRWPGLCYFAPLGLNQQPSEGSEKYWPVSCATTSLPTISVYLTACQLPDDEPLGNGSLSPVNNTELRGISIRVYFNAYAPRPLSQGGEGSGRVSALAPSGRGWPAAGVFAGDQARWVCSKSKNGIPH